MVARCADALLRAAWPSRHPRAALGAWLALLAAGLSGTLWVGLMSVASVQHVGVDVGHLLHVCLVTAADVFRHPSAALTTVAGAVACLALLRVARAGVRESWTGRRARREQRDLLDLVAASGGEVGGRRLRLLPADQPVAYCIPGAGGRIVLSTATRDLLAADELEAVLAHERAHLAGGHHLLLAPARVLLAAAPGVAVLRRISSAMAMLVEMAADDRACRDASRPALARALVKLGLAPAPAPGLQATGGATTARVLRLLEPPTRASLQPGLLAGAAGALLVLPWVVAGVPVGLAVTGHCLV